MVDRLTELRIIRIMGPETASLRGTNEQFLSRLPEYRFAIHRRPDGARVGRIHIRVTTDERIVGTIGHCGYAIDEAHRRNGYATHAVILIGELARYWNILPLWILIEPDNIASRHTVERAGFELVDTIDSAPEIVALGIGERVCRYRVQDKQI